MKDNSKKDWWEVLKMKSRSIIDAPEEETPFQIEENDNPPNLGDINMDDDVEIVPEDENGRMTMSTRRLTPWMMAMERIGTKGHKKKTMIMFTRMMMTTSMIHFFCSATP